VQLQRFLPPTFDFLIPSFGSEPEDLAPPALSVFGAETFFIAVGFRSVCFFTLLFDPVEALYSGASSSNLLLAMT